MGLPLFDLAFFGMYERRFSTMAQRFETTYASQIASLDRQIVAIEQQIRAEHELIDVIKRPGALLNALMSARVRQDALHESYRGRARIAQLERDLAQARSEREEFKRLQMLYPEHDHLIEQNMQLRYRSWHLTLQEDEMDLEERGVLVAERLEQKRLQKEEERIQQELNELAQQQEELEKKRAVLAKKAGSLKKLSRV